MQKWAEVFYVKEGHHGSKIKTVALLGGKKESLEKKLAIFPGCISSKYYRGSNTLDISGLQMFSIFLGCKYSKYSIGTYILNQYSRGANILDIAGVQTKQGELMGHLKISSAVLVSA